MKATQTIHPQYLRRYGFQTVSESPDNASRSLSIDRTLNTDSGILLASWDRRYFELKLLWKFRTIVWDRTSADCWTRSQLLVSAEFHQPWWTRLSIQSLSGWDILCLSSLPAVTFSAWNRAVWDCICLRTQAATREFSVWC